MKRRASILCFAIGIVASAARADSVQFNWTGFFARELSAYNFFADPVTQRPNDGLIPYDIITPLFSDYAYKQRFIFLPPGRSVEYSATDVFSFPVGTALIKTFFYPHDFRKPSEGRRLIETRLLVHTEDKGWIGAAYAWNDEQTDATLSVVGQRVDVEWIHKDGEYRRIRYIIPNMNQCKFCHAGHGHSTPLGLTARQLNHDYDDPEFGAGNQLADWAARGILENAPSPKSAPRVASWTNPDSGTVFDRVRGYLDTNCSHCHRPDGLASSKRIDLRYSQTEPWRRGVELRSTGGSHAESGLEKVIVPGHPERSSLYLRMRSTDFTFMMPQLGRSIVHSEGTDLIAEWIRSLTDGEMTRP